MPRQNRVTPYGELLAVPDRGMFWGNRGPLLDREGRLARYSRGQAWAICVLSFKGRRRQQWRPGRLTELYFLDEATGLAAGHRPCGECRYREYQAFKRAWARDGDAPGAPEIDARMHADRLAGPGERRTYLAPLAGLPSGTMVDIGGAPCLVHDGRLLAWTPGGYRQRPVEAPGGPVTVITPRATVAVLAAGYRPVLHPSALAAQMRDSLCMGVRARSARPLSPPSGRYECGTLHILSCRVPASQATPDQPASPQGVWSHPQDQPVVCRLVAGLVLVSEHVGGHVGQHGTPGG